jgi:hypothetical protein
MDALKKVEKDLEKEYEECMNQILTQSRLKQRLWCDLIKIRKRILELIGVEARGE